MSEQDSSPSSTTTSMSSQRYNLSATSTTTIIVYKLRSGRTYYTNERDLCKELDKDGIWRCSKKPIPRGAGSIDVLTGDLFNEPERSMYAKYPNQTCNMASIGLPRMVFWRRLLFDQFDDLFILSPERSAHTSPNPSSGSSQLPSPI